MSRAVAIIAALCASVAVAQRSPFNGLEVVPPDSSGNYRILIGGHFHGTSTNRSGYPAATLLANLDTINGLGANLLLSTGDLFMDPAADTGRYRRSFFAKLAVPLFNAPGNHDAGKAYERAYGPTHFVIGMGMDRIVLLDTERDNGRVTGEQLATLAGLAEGFSGRHLFIVSHRPLWAEDDPVYGPLFKGNTRSALGTNFRREVLPLLERVAERAQVYWISGSMAGRAPASIFFQPHAPNITYVQCAIRDEPRDALLIADVRRDTVAWSTLSLTGLPVMAPEAHDAVWWRSKQGERPAFQWRLVPYRAGRIVRHKAFWFGAGSAVLLSFLLLRLFRWRR